MTLYEISEDLRAIEELLAESGGEVTDDEAGRVLEAWFDQINEDRDAKIGNYAALIRELEARAEMREQEAARLKAMALADANNARRLKARLKEFFETHQISKIETPRFRVSLQNNGGQPPLLFPSEWETEPAAAPEAFHRHVVLLDKEAIRTAIREGQETHGATEAPRGKHLRIR